jgi:hypothetical protein
MMMVSLLTTLLALAFAQASTAPTITDRINDPKRELGTPVVVGVVGDPVPLSLDDLAHRSELVVEGRVKRVRSYINDADTAVLTDFSILPVRVLAGTIPNAVTKPGPARLLVTTYGGEVVKAGVTVRAENHNLEPLKDGQRYLLFLRHFGSEPGIYQICSGAAFELSDTGSALHPLAHDGSERLYRELASTPYDDVVKRVAAAARRE